MHVPDLRLVRPFEAALGCIRARGGDPFDTLFYSRMKPCSVDLGSIMIGQWLTILI
ncbi:MAG TPA: hypothetical protein VEK34_03515 [Methylocella sp.]|nr:hypothetical protein [Methylocella sp.]